MDSFTAFPVLIQANFSYLVYCACSQLTRNGAKFENPRETDSSRAGAITTSLSRWTRHQHTTTSHCDDDAYQSDATHTANCHLAPSVSISRSQASAATANQQKNIRPHRIDAGHVDTPRIAAYCRHPADLASQNDEDGVSDAADERQFGRRRGERRVGRLERRVYAVCWSCGLCDASTGEREWGVCSVCCVVIVVRVGSCGIWVVPKGGPRFFGYE